MALTQEYVDSVLGAPKLDRPRPSLKQIKEKVEDTQNVLVGWETVDVLRALDQFYWDVNSAVDAAHDGKVTKGDDWSTGRGKKNKKSQNKQNQKGSNNRSRNSNANQNRGKGNQNQPRQPGAPPGGYQGNQGQRGDGQRPPQRYPRQQQQYQQQQNQQPQQQNQQQNQQRQQQRPPQSHQSQPQQRPPQSQQSQSQQRQQPHHQQQRPQQHSHHRNQQQHQQQQQSQPQQEVYSAQSPSPAASPAPTVPGLQGDWAKRAQMKKIQAQQAAQAPVQPKQLPPQQRPSQPQQPPQQAPIPQQEQPQEQPPQYEEPENPIPEMDNLQVASEQPSEDTVEESPVEEQNEQPEQIDEQPVEEAVEESVQAEEDEQPQIDLNEIRGSDPLFLAPGLPGDSDAYQFRFGAYGSEEVEEEKEHVAVEETVVEDSGAVEDQEADSRPVENKPEIATEEQQPTNEDEGSAQGAFEEAPGKGQNVGFPGQQGSNFENLDDSSLPQVFYPPYAAQQMPAVFLPPNMQPQQARAGQDPSGAKNAGGVDMTQGMPHLQSHPFPPSPYFSSMYGSHMMGADQQASFPYNPLPSDPNAMSDPRMRYPMLDQNLGYHPGSFPQQHQSNSSQHGSQHGVDAGGQRGSPPINGNAQFGNGNANSNSENPKFSQQQGMGGAPHDGMNGGLQNSQNTLNLSQHGAQHGAQEGQQHGAPQMGAHQPPPQPSYPPYFLPPFITQYPPMVHPMRGGPFFKGPPSSFGAPLDVHGSHGGAGAQSPFFADQGKGNQQQKHFGHLAESQEGPYEKAQSPQSSTQNQNQQNQGSFQQGGYSGFPMHSFQQPQN